MELGRQAGTCCAGRDGESENTVSEPHKSAKVAYSESVGPASRLPIHPSSALALVPSLITLRLKLKTLPELRLGRKTLPACPRMHRFYADLNRKHSEVTVTEF